MKWIKEEGTQVKLIFAGMIFVLAAVVLPLFIISHYNFRSADDYEFSKTGEVVWDETHSIVKVMTEQASYTADMYRTWQGTYSDIWLTTTVMGLFAKNHYYVGTYLSLGGFLLAEAFLLMVILVKILGSDIFRAGIVSMGCLCMQVLMVPMPNEAFFWFTGAMRYVFIHSCGLLLLAVLLMLYQSRKIWQIVIAECVIVLLNITVGGGNYITALTVLIFYFLALLWTIIQRHPCRWIYLGDTLFFLIAFLVNCLAPGNRVRQAASGAEPMSPIPAIVYSLWEALQYIISNTILPGIILGVLFLPLFLNIVRRKRYRYPWPLLVSLVSFGFFAAQFTPNLYALRVIGAGRVQNLYRLNFYLWLYGNELYWVGYAVRKGWLPDKAGAAELEKTKTSFLLPGWLFGGVFLCLSLFLWGGKTLTSLSAIKDLREGTAKIFYQENQERIEQLTDAGQEVVYLKPFTYKPYVLYFTDIEPTSDWKNYLVASYYGKKDVWLLEEDE